MASVRKQLSAIVQKHGSADEFLLPGASTTVITEAEKEFGFSFTDPLKELYSCFNGTQIESGRDPMAARSIWPTCWLLSLRDASTSARKLLQIKTEHVEMFGGGREMEPGWFPFLEGLGQRFILIDLSPVSPTHGQVISADNEGGSTTWACSLPAFLDLVLEGYHRGLYRLSKKRQFKVDWDGLDDLRKERMSGS